MFCLKCEVVWWYSNIDQTNPLEVSFTRKMSEPKNSLAARIACEIQRNLLYPNFRQELQHIVASDMVALADFKNSVLHQLQRGTLDSKLRNLVYHCLRERCQGFKRASKEPLDYVKKAQATWEKRLWKSVVSMAKEMKAPLARGRLNSEQEMIEENWSEISQWDLDLSKFKPIFSPKDFLDCILEISNPNYTVKGPEQLWSSFPGIPFKVTSLRELKSVFVDLTTSEPHFGLIQVLEAGDLTDTSAFLKSVQVNRNKLGEIVAADGKAATSQEYLKKGCPILLRGKVWQNVLGSQVTPEHSLYYCELKQSVIKSDMLIDRIVLKDVQLTAANNDEYFVFEDSLYQTLLCFSRDVSLLDLFEHSSKTPMRGVVKSKGSKTSSVSEGTTVVYPFNGVIPFHGFTMYVAPLCFVYDDPEALYFTFRSLYRRYWFRLHEVSSHENGIISLCLLFEKLLHRHETQLWLHLKALRVFPIRVVFKWLIKAFSGYLPAEQLLQLWDLLMAYNSVQILPLFAFGVLSSRRSNLLRALQSQTVENMLADLSSIAVLPVLLLALGKVTLY